MPSSVAAALRFTIRGLVPAFFVIVVLSAEAASPSTTPLQRESLIIAAAHDAARADNYAEVDTQLGSPSGGTLAELPASIVLARRALAVCSALRNENDFARAAKLAGRVVAQLAPMTETNDANRVERLIAEATLNAEFVGDKKQALALLQVAEKLAPDDQRIPPMEAGLTNALAAFGN